MGQQQLLLLALSAIIVGLSIVVGFNMFSENAAQANLDAVTNDVLSIASRAHSWARKPTAFLGGGGKFDDLTFDKIGYSSTVDALAFENENGNYALTVDAGTNSITIVGTGRETLDDDPALLTVTVVVNYLTGAGDIAVTR